MKPNLTADRLRYLLNYDPETGIFTRRISVAKYPAGQIAGCQVNHGGKLYVRIGVDGRDYYAQRLAWLHVTGGVAEWRG